MMTPNIIASQPATLISDAPSRFQKITTTAATARTAAAAAATAAQVNVDPIAFSRRLSPPPHQTPPRRDYTHIPQRSNLAYAATAHVAECGTAALLDGDIKCRPRASIRKRSYFMPDTVATRRQPRSRCRFIR